MAASAKDKLETVTHIIYDTMIGMIFKDFSETPTHNIMYSDCGVHFFKIMKDTGQIIYGKFDWTKMQWIEKIL